MEIAITRIEGKWKVSENRPVADREGVVAGLRAPGDEAPLAMPGVLAERSPEE